MLHTSETKSNRRTSNWDANKLYKEDRAAHNWYRFVLSFPPHLVRDYLERFSIENNQVVLDPFCGTGTTLVECKKLGVPSVGVEANVMAHFASQVKVDWSPDPDGLVINAERIAEDALKELQLSGIADGPLPLFGNSSHQPGQLCSLSEESMKLLLTNSISPLPLHKTLVLLQQIRKNSDKQYHRHETLALAKVLVYSISNLRFGPEVGLGPLKSDAAVVSSWMKEIEEMADDLRRLRAINHTSALVYQADSRQLLNVLTPNSIDAVITSPPYPNEKDYTRTTRLESVVLGFIRDKKDLRALKQRLVRSNTRNVFVDDDDDQRIATHPEVQRIADEIEAKRIELAKTSGFEKLYGRVTKLYFSGMGRHLADLRQILKPGAQLAYVVGDQASYFRVMIRTGQLLAEIAQSLGYELIGIDLFRTRLATATKEQLREEVVVLRWPGPAITKF